MGLFGVGILKGFVIEVTVQLVSTILLALARKDSTGMENPHFISNQIVMLLPLP